MVRLLRAGHSVRHAAKITGGDSSTVQRVKAALSWTPVGEAGANRVTGGNKVDSIIALRLTS